MGSKSKSRNNSTSTNASQMAALQRNNPRVTFDEAHGNQQTLQASLMEQVAPFFGAMMQMGQQQMDSNPMLKAFGPVSDGERSTLQDMIAALTPQQQAPQQPQPLTSHPQFNINPQVGNLTPDQQHGLMKFDQFGGIGRR